MTEGEARDWLYARFGADVVDMCARFVALLLDESKRQNLISAGSMTSVWFRHVVDSAQLIELAPATGRWIDIGTGAGFPGLIIAIIRLQPIVLIEPRNRRAEFLRRVAADLGLDHAEVTATRAERVSGSADIISARAVASLATLFDMGEHLAKVATTWIVPKGTRAELEISDAKRYWSGVFHVKHSITSDSAGIVTATQVSRL